MVSCDEISYHMVLYRILHINPVTHSSIDIHSVMRIAIIAFRYCDPDQAIHSLRAAERMLGTLAG